VFETSIAVTHQVDERTLALIGEDGAKSGPRSHFLALTNIDSSVAGFDGDELVLVGADEPANVELTAGHLSGSGLQGAAA
jgi:hypothetical protein